jgi:hypothetical protein
MRAMIGNRKKRLWTFPSSMMMEESKKDELDTSWRTGKHQRAMREGSNAHKQQIASSTHRRVLLKYQDVPFLEHVIEDGI